MSDVQMKIEGFDELRKSFRQLPIKVADKVTASAIRAGANPILKKAKALAPVRTGLLRRSLRIKVKKYPRNGSVVAVIGALSRKVQIASRIGGANHGKAVYANPAKYIHLAEGGNYGGQGASHFLSRSFQGAKEPAKERMIRFFRKGLEREGRKLGFK